MSTTDDRFSEREIGLILQRASDAQPGRSLSLTELEAVASEAGLDVALVRRAATELRTHPDPAAAPLPGVFGPTTLAHERRVDGQLGAPAWEDIVGQIRRHLQIDGNVEHFGRDLVWGSQRRGIFARDVRVQLLPRRGQTSIRVHERTGGLALRLYLGIVAGLAPLGLLLAIGLAAEALGVPALIPVFLALWLYASFRLARAVYGSKLATRDSELKRLAADLADTSADLIALPSARTPDE